MIVSEIGLSRMKIKAPAAAVMHTHTHTAACGMGRVLKMIKLPALLVGLTFTKTSSLLYMGTFTRMVLVQPRKTIVLPLAESSSLNAINIK